MQDLQASALGEGPPYLEVNYRTLSVEELAAIAETDPGARQYIADNIALVMRECGYNGESLREFYDEGQDDIRRDLERKFMQPVLQMLDTYKGKGHRELRRLLQQLRNELSKEVGNG